MVIKPFCPIFFNGFTNQLITLNTLNGKLIGYGISTSIKGNKRVINVDGTVYVFAKEDDQLKVYRLNETVKEIDNQ